MQVFLDLTDEGFGVGHLDNVVFGMWLGEVTDRRVDNWLEGIHRVFTSYPNRFSVLLTICESSSPPRRSQRKRLTQGLLKYVDSTGCFATVVEADGFKGSIVRTIIHTMSAFISDPVPREVFKRSGDAAPWVVAQSQERGLTVPDAARMVAAVEQLRASMHGAVIQKGDDDV